MRFSYNFLPTCLSSQRSDELVQSRSLASFNASTSGIETSVYADQLASSEASLTASTLFSKEEIPRFNGKFDIKTLSFLVVNSLDQ